MSTFFFGNTDSRLYGVYESPTAASPRAVGVVLCYPGGHEYIYTHRAFKQLAKLLAQQGFHVLRFDFFGTGDSSGTSRDANVAHWTQDVATSVEELRETSGAKRISIIGLRLGAALAAMAARRELDVEDLVLWDPVVDGSDYLRSLERAHERRLSDPVFFPIPRLRDPGDSSSDDLLGYAYPDGLRRGLTEIDLRRERMAPRRVIIVTSAERPEYAELEAHARSLGIPCERLQAPDPPEWYQQEHLYSFQVPSATLNDLASILARHTNDRESTLLRT